MESQFYYVHFSEFDWCTICQVNLLLSSESGMSSKDNFMPDAGPLRGLLIIHNAKYISLQHFTACFSHSFCLPEIHIL